MKNTHVLKTDKPSRLFYNVGGALLFTNYENYNGVNIYITSDERIERGDWVFDAENEEHIYRASDVDLSNIRSLKSWYCKKIILTTDVDLIKYGVQAIDDEFLEWFVKNPSCEEVEVEKYHGINTSIAEVNAISGDNSLNWQGKDDLRDYKIIIPKEEPKQETIEDIEDLYLMKNVRLWLKTQQDLADKIIFKNK